MPAPTSEISTPTSTALVLKATGPRMAAVTSEGKDEKKEETKKAVINPTEKTTRPLSYRNIQIVTSVEKIGHLFDDTLYLYLQKNICDETKEPMDEDDYLPPFDGIFMYPMETRVPEHSFLEGEIFYLQCVNGEVTAIWRRNRKRYSKRLNSEEIAEWVTEFPQRGEEVCKNYRGLKKDFIDKVTSLCGYTSIVRLRGYWYEGGDRHEKIFTERDTIEQLLIAFYKVYESDPVNRFTTAQDIYKGYYTIFDLFDKYGVRYIIRDDDDLETIRTITSLFGCPQPVWLREIIQACNVLNPGGIDFLGDDTGEFLSPRDIIAGMSEPLLHEEKGIVKATIKRADDLLNARFRARAFHCHSDKSTGAKDNREMDTLVQARRTLQRAIQELASAPQRKAAFLASQELATAKKQLQFRRELIAFRAILSGPDSGPEDAELLKHFRDAFIINNIQKLYLKNNFKFENLYKLYLKHIKGKEPQRAGVFAIFRDRAFYMEHTPPAILDRITNFFEDLQSKESKPMRLEEKMSDFMTRSDLVPLQKLYLFEKSKCALFNAPTPFEDLKWKLIKEVLDKQIAFIATAKNEDPSKYTGCSRVLLYPVGTKVPFADERENGAIHLQCIDGKVTAIWGQYSQYIKRLNPRKTAALITKFPPPEGKIMEVNEHKNHEFVNEVSLLCGFVERGDFNYDRNQEQNSITRLSLDQIQAILEDPYLATVKVFVLDAIKAEQDKQEAKAATLQSGNLTQLRITNNKIQKLKDEYKEIEAVLTDAFRAATIDADYIRSSEASDSRDEKVAEITTIGFYATSSYKEKLHVQNKIEIIVKKYANTPEIKKSRKLRIIMKMNNEYYDGEQLSTHLSAGSNYLT